MKRLVPPVLPGLPVLTVLSLAVLLAGCGGSDAPDAATASSPASSPAAPASTAGAAGGESGAAGTASPSPAPPSATAAVFNPCDSLSAAKVSAALGAKVRITTGTADAPRCALLPAKKNGPTFELSYLWFDGGLDAAWKTMDVPTGSVTTPTVAGADDARQVVQRTDSAYAVSAFLQNGSLIQSLNGLALAPYDTAGMKRATTEILEELSAGAPAR